MDIDCIAQVKERLNKFSLLITLLRKDTISCTKTQFSSCELGLSGFHRYEHLIPIRQKFQNILERKLCNCFGQLLYIYLKKFNDGIEHDVDSAYGVCIHFRHS